MPKDPLRFHHKHRRTGAFGEGFVARMAEQVARRPKQPRVTPLPRRARTLTRDFGEDPNRLAAEIRRTVRHELAHHLGYRESGVRALGL